jgi:hypothetical protein
MIILPVKAVPAIPGLELLTSSFGNAVALTVLSLCLCQ